jgi:thioredoxin 1
MIAPIFKELSDAFPNVVFLKVDVDENPETAAKYEVSAMPTFLFIKRGEVVDKVMGANAAALQKLLGELS